jgi:chromosome segregation ATPase
MNSWRYGIMIFLGLVAILQGCSQSGIDKATSESDNLQKSIADLQSQLTQTKQSLSRFEDENQRLTAELQAAGVKSNMAEQRALEKSSQGRVQTKGAELKGTDEESRIGLMGAKAIAEFRAEQLRKRLDKLSKDLDLKEQELVAIRQNAETKDKEVASLSGQIQELQEADRTRTSELESKLDRISKELAERSTAMGRLKQELDEKTDLLHALKNAVADAAKLKSNAEIEVTRLQSELTQAASQADAVGKQAGQLRRDVEQLQNQAVRTREDIDQCREQSEQLRADAESSRQESQRLKAELSDLGQRLQAAEPTPPAAVEDHPSALDNLLQGPQSAGTSSRPSGLY